MLQRLAVVEMFEYRLEDAMGRVEESLALLDGADASVSLIVRAQIQCLKQNYEASVTDAGCALQGLDPKKNEKAYLSAVICLGNSVVRGGGGSESIAEVGRLLTAVKRKFRGKRSRSKSVGWIYLEWVEAQIMGRCGSHRRAIDRLMRVKQKLYEAGGGYFRDGFLASVDLAVVYEACGEFAAAKRECRDALGLALAMGFEREANILRIQLSKGWLGGVEKELRELP